MIVVAGESLVDLIADGDGALRPLPGGGPFNVARALARLEVRCAFLGAVSADRFGAALRGALAADGVDLRCVVAAEAPTTLAVAELDAEGAACYRFYAEGTAAPSLTAAEAAAAVAGVPCSALHVGSLGLALEPIGTAVEALVADAAPETLVMVDPNWRPGAVVDPDAWRARLGRVLGRADVVKASADDLAHLVPDRSPREAGRALLAGGAGCALITDGAGDVLIMTADGERRVRPPAVRVVDTVGAGDAFGAGFLAWWTASRLGREDLRDVGRLQEAAAFAALVAARTCERAGADPPRRRELGTEAPAAA
jgi:fructokinase